MKKGNRLASLITIPLVVFLCFGLGWAIRYAREQSTAEAAAAEEVVRPPAIRSPEIELNEGKTLIEKAHRELENGENLKAILTAAESIGFTGYGRNGENDDRYPICLGEAFRDSELEKTRLEYFQQANAIITQPRQMEIPVWSSDEEGWDRWISDIQFTNDELFFAFGSDPDGRLRGTIEIFNSIDGSKFERVEGFYSINNLKFSRDSRYLYCSHTNMNSYREPRFTSYCDFFGGLRGATKINEELYEYLDSPRSPLAPESSFAWNDPQFQAKEWRKADSRLDWLREKYECEIVEGVYGKYPEEVYFLTNKNEIIWSPGQEFSARLSLSSISDSLIALSVAQTNLTAIVSSESGDVYTVDLFRPWEWDDHDGSYEHRVHGPLTLDDPGPLRSLKYVPSEDVFAFESENVSARISARGEPPSPTLINITTNPAEGDKDLEKAFESVNGPLGRRELLRLPDGKGLVSNRIFSPRLFRHVPASSNGIEISRGAYGGRDGYADIMFLDDGGILIIEPDGRLKLHEPQTWTKIGSFSGKLPPELIKYLCENTQLKQKHLGLASHGYGGRGRLFARSSDQLYIVRTSIIEVYDLEGNFIRSISPQDGDSVEIWGIFNDEPSKTLVALVSQVANDSRTIYSSQQICHIEKNQWTLNSTSLGINFTGRNIYRSLGSQIISNGRQFFYQPLSEKESGQVRRVGNTPDAVSIAATVSTPYFLLEDRFIFQAESGKVLINDLKNGTIEPAGFQFQDNTIRTVVHCPAKRFVAIATTGSNIIELLDFDTGRKLLEIVGPGSWKGDSPVKSLHLNCNGNRLLIEGHDGYWCWDLESLSLPFISISEGEDLDLLSLRTEWDQAIALEKSPRDKFIPTSDTWRAGEQFQIPELKTLSSQGRDSRSSHIESAMTYYTNNGRYDEARLLWEEEERYFTETARHSLLLLFAEKCRQNVRLLNSLYEQVPNENNSKDEESKPLLKAHSNGIVKDLNNSLDLFLAVAEKSNFANFHSSNFIVDFGLDVAADRSDSSFGYSFYEWFEANAPIESLKVHQTRIRNLALSESLSQIAQKRFQEMVMRIDSPADNSDEEE